ncbi:MAG: hypothetical protein LWY06_13815 [Firmicutes bacterium]|nr:hypothetical protein [Bacillota bacterium]
MQENTNTRLMDSGQIIESIINHSVYSGDRSLPLLQDLFDNEDKIVSAYAKKAHEIITKRNGAEIPPDSIPVMPGYLKNSDDKTKMDSIKKIVDGKYQNFLLALIDLASGEKDEYIRSSAVVAVGTVSAGDETGFIACFLKDPSPNVRLSALTALSIGNTPDLAILAAPLILDANREISSMVERILNNSSPEKRQEAVSNLLESEVDYSGQIYKIVTSVSFSRDFLIFLLKSDRFSAEYAEKLAIFMLSRYETSPDMTRQLRSALDNRNPGSTDYSAMNPAHSAVTRILEESSSDGSEGEEERILASHSPDDPDIKKGRDFILKKLADSGIMKLKPFEVETDDSLLKLTEQYRSLAKKLDDKNDEMVRTENKQVEQKGGFFQQALGSLGKMGNVAKIKLELSQLQLDMDSLRNRLGERIHHLCLIGKISDEDLNNLSGKCQYASIKAKREREAEEKRRVEKESAAIEKGRAYFEKAGDVFNNLTNRAVSFTRTQTLTASIEGEKANRTAALRELGNLAYTECKKGAPIFFIPEERINAIDELKGKIHLLEMESKGGKSSLTDKLQTDGKSFLDMASNIMGDLKSRSEKAKSLFDLNKEIADRKRELDVVIISTGEDLVSSSVVTESAAAEQLKTRIRNQSLKIREIEVELKKIMEEISRDDLAVMLQKRKDLEEDVNGINREILEKYGQQLTIIFTDMKGFTEKSSQKGLVKTMEMLEEHDKILIPIIKRCNGRIIKQIGDAIMASFRQPADAVLASMEIQKVLKKHNETPDEEKRIQVRIGINCGMVIVKESDLFGDTVNIASRVEGLADGEEIYITESVYDYLDKEAISVEKLEPRQVKGIREAIRIFKVLY